MPAGRLAPPLALLRLRRLRVLTCPGFAPGRSVSALACALSVAVFARVLSPLPLVVCALPLSPSPPRPPGSVLAVLTRALCVALLVFLFSAGVSRIDRRLFNARARRVCVLVDRGHAARAMLLASPCAALTSASWRPLARGRARCSGTRSCCAVRPCLNAASAPGDFLVACVRASAPPPPAARPPLSHLECRWRLAGSFAIYRSPRCSRGVAAASA